MKRGGADHPKTLQLAAILGIPKYAAVGVLETLFHVVGQHLPCGDLGRWPDDRIAIAIGWDQEPERLIAGLLQAGWIEPHPEARLVVHDWAEHAEDLVKKLVARRGWVFYGTRTTKVEQSQNISENFRNVQEKSLIPIPIPIPEEGAVETAPDTSVLEQEPELARYWPTFQERVRKAHPNAKIAPARSRQEREEQGALEALVRLDGFAAREVVAVLEWVWTSTDRDAVFWRQQVCGARGLRERRRGAPLSKFGRIHEAWASARARARPADEPARMTAVVLEPFGGRARV